MAVGRWKILLVEDDREDYLLTKEMLAEARGRKYLLEWASDYEFGKQAILSTSFDAILMDYDLGRKSGIDLTREVSALGCKSPIILLTGRGNYEVDMEAMQNGVTDYLSKSRSTHPRSSAPYATRSSRNKPKKNSAPPKKSLKPVFRNGRASC